MKHSPLLLIPLLFLTACSQTNSTPQPERTPTASKVQLGSSTATTPVPKTDSGWVKRNELLTNNAANFDGELIFIGDSITQGWEGAGKKVWEDHFAKRGALNLGISGDRTQHVIWRLANGNLSGIKPSKTGKRVAVFMIGTNNTGQGGNAPQTNTASEIADGVIACVQTYHELEPDSKILLLGVFPRGEAPGEIRETIKALNAKASSVANGADIRYLDISDKFLAPNGYITKAIMPDFLHLSSQGYEIWASAIEPTLKEMLH